MIRLLLLAGIIGSILLGSAGGARAHAVVLETVPADGAVLEAAPDAVIIRLNEPVTPLSAQVLDATGRDITAAGALTAVNLEVRIALPADLPSGSYVASYRLVSIDSHPISGSIVFSVGEGAGSIAVPAVGSEGAGWRAALLAAQIGLYACLLVAAGGVLFQLWVAPSEPTAGLVGGIVRRASVAGALVAVVAVGLQGGLLLDAPAGALSDLALWRTGAASSFGRGALVAAGGLGLIASGMAGRHRSMRWPALAGAALRLGSFAASGHVITAGPVWLTAPLLVVHAGAVAFWIGALLPLERAIHRLGRDAAPLVERFSKIAVLVVPLLVATGLGIAILQVQRPMALIHTNYGRLLLVKLTAVAGLLVIAAMNKLRLTAALRRGGNRLAAMLRVTIGAELVLLVLILAATAGLGTTPPPRVTAPEPMPADHAHHGEAHFMSSATLTAASGDLQVQATISPARADANVMEIVVTDRTGTTIAGREVSVALANRAAGVEPIRRSAMPTGAGTWLVTDLVLTPAGAWSVRIEVLVDDFRKPIFEAEIAIR